jgi:hypothetical protein
VQGLLFMLIELYLKTTYFGHWQSIKKVQIKKQRWFFPPAFSGVGPLTMVRGNISMKTKNIY